MARLEILSSLSEEGYSATDIEQVLLEGGMHLTQHGDAFTGRPGTHIIACSAHVIKLRTEINPISIKDVHRFVDNAVQRERKLGIYPPRKTWFLIHEEGHEIPRIANITPRLSPLHESEKLIEEHGESRYRELICQLFDLYLNAAATHEVGLDISLSNFAIDEAGKLYYVDDDVYGWDEFHSLIHFLGILVRTLPFDEDAIDKLAGCVRQTVLKHFDDPHWISVIAEDVRSLFVAEERKALLRKLVGSLTEDRPISVHVERPVPQPAMESGTRTETPSASPSGNKVAILADIHANVAALERVLAYLDDRNITQGYVLGDVVGYGPNPRECIDLLRSHPGLLVIKGNHDHAVATGRYALGFSAYGRHVVEWTTNQLDDNYKRWLSELPLYITGQDWLAVHGSPNDKTFFNAYVYDMTFEDNLDTLEERKIRFCFHGHSHLQKVYYRKKREDSSSTAEQQSLDDYQSALICPGSVGQPRNGVPGTEFAILDLDSWELEFIHLDYDILRTVERMRELDFPPALHERLLAGR